MLILRKNQVEALAELRAQVSRDGLAAQLRAHDYEASHEPAAQRIRVRDAEGSEGVITFEPGTLVVTAPDGGTSRLAFDAQQRLASTTDPSGLRVDWEHDEQGALRSIRRSDGSAWQLEHDADGELLSIGYPDGSTARFVRDESGRLLESHDRNGAVTRHECGDGGRPVRLMEPTGSVTAYEWSEGELTAIVDAIGRRQEYRPDLAEGRVHVDVEGARIATLSGDGQGTLRVDHPDEMFVELVQRDGRLCEVRSETRTLRLDWDDEGRLTAEESEDGRVAFTRNAVGSLTGLTHADGTSVSFERDAMNRVRRVVDWNGGVHEVEHSPEAGLSAIRHANGVVSRFEMLPTGRWGALEVEGPAAGPALLDLRWTYDACDRVVSETSRGLRTDFERDAEGRLLSVRSGEVVAERFELDEMGNRLVDHGLDCAYDACHQISRRGDERFQHDVQGRMTRAGDLELSWGGPGRLIEALGPRGFVRYEYDGLGRRVLKVSKGLVTRYWWAGQLLIAEETLTAAGSRRREWLYIPETGMPIAVRIDGRVHAIHAGRRNEPLLVTDPSGRVAWAAEYDAFGTARATVQDIDQPLRLAGQYFDDETGLHYNVARYLDPKLGRFLSVDPLGRASGNPNPYTYCDGDPLDKIDPTGEIIPLLIAGALIGAAIGAGIEIYRQKSASPNGDLDWGKVGKEALIGGAVGVIGAAVGAALAPVAAGLGATIAAVAAGGALVGGVAAAVETCADAVIRGRPVTAREILQSAGIGALIGSVTAGAGGVWARRLRQLRKPPAPPVPPAPARPRVPPKTPSRIPGGGLAAHEGADRGHTLEHHVGRTDEQLRERLAEEKNSHLKRVSTFTDEAEADHAISEVLKENAADIDDWVSKGRPGGKMKLPLKKFEDSLGRIVTRGDLGPGEPGHHVRVFLQASDDANGWYIKTAFVEP